MGAFQCPAENRLVAGGAYVIQMHDKVRKLGVRSGRHFGNRRPACKLVSAIYGSLAIRGMKRRNAFRRL
jgi:hypothetical protein